MIVLNLLHPTSVMLKGFCDDKLKREITYFYGLKRIRPGPNLDKRGIRESIHKYNILNKTTSTRSSVQMAKCMNVVLVGGAPKESGLMEIIYRIPHWK